MSRATEAAHKRRMEEDHAARRDSLDEPMGTRLRPSQLRPGEEPPSALDEYSMQEAGDSYWSDYGD